MFWVKFSFKNRAGKCTNFDSCTCNNGYSGCNCQISPLPIYCYGISSSNPRVCNGNGICAAGICVCTSPNAVSVLLKLKIKG